MTGRVTAWLRRYIAEQRLGPGNRLPGEGEISRILGVSRPVVREAASGLAALGLLDLAPGRPPRVSRLGGQALHHMLGDALITGQATGAQILEVRRGLEIAMAGLAAERRDDRLAAKLAALLPRMRAALPTPAHYTVLDADFHRLLAEATGNPFYQMLVDGARAAFEESIEIGLRHRFKPAALDRVQTLHQEIAEAVIAGNRPGAEAAMTRHFDDALAALYQTQETA